MSKENKGREFTMFDAMDVMSVVKRKSLCDCNGGPYEYVSSINFQSFIDLKAAFEKYQAEKEALEQRLAEAENLLDQSEYAIRMFKEQTESHGGDYLPGHAQLFNTVRDRILGFKASLDDGSKDD